MLVEEKLEKLWACFKQLVLFEITYFLGLLRLEKAWPGWRVREDVTISESFERRNGESGKPAACKGGGQQLQRNAGQGKN